MATVGSAIVCDYMETGLFAIVCDPRSFAIIWKPAFTRRVSATVSYISTRIPFKISSCGTEITRALKLIPDTTVSLREEQKLLSLSFQFFRTLLHSYLRNFSRRFGRETASPYDTYINF